MSAAGTMRAVWRATAMAGYAAALLPPIAMLVLILRLAVNVPFEDDWDMLPVVTHWHAGTLGLQDFWQQHSEHRIIALKAAIWAIGVVTDFNVVAEALVGFAMAAATLALLARLMHESLAAHAPLVPAALLPICSLLLFSLVGHESWFWGTASLQFFLLNLCTVVMIRTLTRSPDDTASLALGFGCAVIGGFSEASGLVLWITGAAAILVASAPATRVARLLTWTVVACLIVGLYLWDLQGATSSLAGAVSQPTRVLLFAGACLGMPFAAWSSAQWSALVGWTGFAAFCLAAWHVRSRDRILFHKLLPVLLLATHAFLAVLLIAVGRSDGGLQSALTSHYAFAPTLFWIAVVVVGGAVIATVPAGWMARVHSVPLAMGVILIGFLALGFAQTNAAGFQDAYARSRNLRMAEASLFSDGGPSREVLRYVYSPDEDRARRLIAELRHYQLGPFSTDLLRAMSSVPPPVAVDATEAAEGFHDGGDCDGTIGWAWDPTAPDRPVELDIWVGDTRLGTVTANWFRWDLLQAGKGDGRHAFRFVFPTQSELETGRVVTVTFAGTKRALGRSPRTVPCRD